MYTLKVMGMSYQSLGMAVISTEISVGMGWRGHEASGYDEVAIRDYGCYG